MAHFLTNRLECSTKWIFFDKIETTYPDRLWSTEESTIWQNGQSAFSEV